MFRKEIDLMFFAISYLSQGLMIGPHMKCDRTMIIAEDTCNEGLVYMPVLHQTMALHLFSFLSKP